MEVRCASCNKLFHVSDDRITGSGIKFPCTRCHETVKITKEEFEQYKLAGEAALLLASAASKPSKTAAVPATPEPTPIVPPPDFPTAADDSSVFDLSDPASAAAALSEQQRVEEEGEIPGLFEEAVRPEPSPAPVEPQTPAPVQEEPVVAKPEPVAASAVPPIQEPSKPETAAVPKVEAKAAPRPEPPVKPSAAPKPESRPSALQSEEAKKTPKPKTAVPARPVPGPEASAPLAALLDKEASAPSTVVIDAASHASASGFRNKVIMLAVVLLVAAAAVFGVQSYLKKEAGTDQAARTTVALTSPDGLQILNPSAGFDSAKGDLVITGTVQNSTDKPRPGWLVVVEVFDAQNTLIAKARLLNGKQLYTKRDLEILAKRGANIDTLKAKNTDPAVTIPPKGSVNFEIRILDAPAGVSSFNAVLQPYDPIQIYRELAEEQK